MTLRTVSDLVVIALSAIALASSGPVFRRWKSSVIRKAHTSSDQKLEAFLQSQILKIFVRAWLVIITGVLLIAVWDLLTQS